MKNKEEELNNIINEIFTLTGEKVDKNDPLVISCIINKSLIEKQTEDHLKSTQEVINSISNIIVNKSKNNKNNIPKYTLILAIWNNIFILIITIFLFLTVK